MGIQLRWREEIDTYREMKSLFVLEGNLLDQYPLEVEEDSMMLVSLEEYLHQYLRESGYETIVFYNRIDHFYNHLEEGGDLARFREGSGMAQPKMGRSSMSDDFNAIRRALGNGQSAPCAVVVDLASLLAGGPDHLAEVEIEHFMTLFLGIREAVRGCNKDGHWLGHLLFLLVNKANDLPAWLYLRNPYGKVITLPLPARETRAGLIASHREEFPDASACQPEELEKLERNLVGITEGFTCMELDRLLSLCCQRGTAWRELPTAVNAYRYGQPDDPWSRLRSEDLRDLEQTLERDVKGQSAAIAAAAGVVKRAASGISGLQHSGFGRPKGVLFLAGPTGTGKTELAKAIARTLFGDESALLRFDMSEYSHAHSDQRLMGAPPGYVGYDAGGELTNAVKAHPFSILLFDEIEKAHPTILDKFLQILDDGRMTDSKGETVYFTESILIFTSNKGMYRLSPEGVRIPLVTPGDPYPHIQEVVNQAVREYFITELGRPEILNRIGNNLVVFDFIRPAAVPLILQRQVESVLQGLRERRGISASLGQDTQAWELLLRRGEENLEFGGRGIGNVVEQYLLNPLSQAILAENWTSGFHYRLLRLERGEAGTVVLQAEKTALSKD